jgi:geranylgeranyl pyrophosphate synthase
MSEEYDTSLIQVIAPPKNLYELILQIRKRPGMYLRTANISAMENFINGYTYVCHFKDIDENEKPAWGEFHEFVRKRTGFYESTSGWCGMILSVNDQDEVKALAMFFNLFEAFLASAE